MVDLPTLKTELMTDPQGYGYAAHIDLQVVDGVLVNLGSNQLLAGLVNKVRAAEPIPREYVPASEIITAIVPADWDRINDASDRELCRMYLSLGEIPASNQNVLDGFQTIFGSIPGQTTIPALNALRTRDGSRAETLFGEGTQVTKDEVRQALVLP